MKIFISCCVLLAALSVPVENISAQTVAILDEGVSRPFTYRAKSKFVQSSCFSYSDSFVNDPGVNKGLRVLRMSMCKNGQQSDLFGVDAAGHPRGRLDPIHGAGYLRALAGYLRDRHVNTCGTGMLTLENIASKCHST